MNAGSQSILQQLSSNIQTKHTEGLSHLNLLTNLFTQYKEVVEDIIKTKIRYVDLVQKYATVKTPSLPASLPGLGFAAYSIPNLKSDSEEIQALSKLINELESQRELIYFQTRRLLEAVINNTSAIVDTSNQLNNFLDDLIANTGDIYGSANLRSKEV